MATKVKMKKFSAISFLILVYVHLYGQEVSGKPETYFDFWVGKWSASWDEPDNKKGYGTNHIRKVLDGVAIEENFEITDGQNKGFKGKSLSVYHAQTETWKQCWTDNQSGFYYFKGIIAGDKRIFQTEPIDRPNGQKLTQRMVFYDITKEAMTWDWESSLDGGATWNLNWRIEYKRLE